MRKTRQTGSSGNTNWQNKLSRYVSHHAFRIVDKTTNNLPKRVIVFVKNTASGFEESVTFWIDTLFCRETVEFSFNVPNYVHGTLNGVVLEPCQATDGRKYGLNEAKTAIVDTGSALSGGEFLIENSDEENDLVIAIYRSGNILATATIAVEDDATFDFRPTFWIYVTEDLEEEVGVEDVNTEISTLGIAHADVEVTKTGENPYQMSLTNIVAA